VETATERVEAVVDEPKCLKAVVVRQSDRFWRLRDKYGERDIGSDLQVVFSDGERVIILAEEDYERLKAGLVR